MPSPAYSLTAGHTGAKKVSDTFLVALAIGIYLSGGAAIFGLDGGGRLW